jgi:alkanesulfonate monooxygenase SsuD/methylene tetrahydromethanopterin reductase-like flavin-dependent oxidoreductase (luciferase family)
MTTFVARYDMRCPDPSRRRELYAAALDHAEAFDHSGLDALIVSEHHAAEDGYIPSPFQLAAAFAARTKRVPISIAALLVNFHDPVRLAEDIAVLDHLSAGRASYVFGLGYRAEEYALFDQPWSTRGRDVEAGIGQLLEIFRTGTHNQMPVTPKPLTSPHPMFFYGGASTAAARRAGRLGLHFYPQINSPELKAAYKDACIAAGRDPGFVMAPGRGPAVNFVADDPDTFWSVAGEHLLHDAMTYQKWHGDNPSYVNASAESVGALRGEGTYRVWSPNELIDACRSNDVQVVSMHPLCGGLPPEAAEESVRLMTEQVIPAVKAP